MRNLRSVAVILLMVGTSCRTHSSEGFYDPQDGGISDTYEQFKSAPEIVIGVITKVDSEGNAVTALISEPENLAKSKRRTPP